MILIEKDQHVAAIVINSSGPAKSLRAIVIYGSEKY